MNQEYIIENAARVPFRDMSKEDQHTILDAKLNAPESVDIDCINHWESSDPEVIHIYAIYRVRAIATPLVIPWDVISPEWDWAAMDEDTEVRLYSDDPVIEGVVWFPRDGRWCSLDRILIVSTTGIVWDRSKTRRPS